MTEAARPFYVLGGTLARDAPCYVARQADMILHDALAHGELCHVLTSRQSGKSSLMVRVATRLRGEGTAVAVVDLTSVGQNLTPEQWYEGILSRLGRQFDLETEVEEAWTSGSDLPPLQRWTRVLHETILPRLDGRIAIFIDEIDYVRSLPFAVDEFFAAIREIYNRRADEPPLARLTFCLIGVTTPSDLIRDSRTTPFNVGRRIELDDFTPAEMEILAPGLGRPHREARAILRRIHHWTGGHPYLTQQLCQAVAEDPAVSGDAGVDRVCRTHFLSSQARERDDNLTFVRERLLRSEVDRAAVLDLYAKVLRGRRVPNDDADPAHSALRLSGITRVVAGVHLLRNPIYRRVFDRAWITANLPDSEVIRQREAFWRGVLHATLIAGVALLAVLAGAWWYYDTYSRVHVEYYTRFDYQWGLPRGINRISREEASHRAFTYRFVRAGRKHPVTRVQAVNGSGALTTDHDLKSFLREPADQDNPALNECDWEFVHDDNGRVVYEKQYNRVGHLISGMIYAPRTDRFHARATFVGPSGFPQAQITSSAQYIAFTYDSLGREIRRDYTDRRGHPRPGPDHAYGQSREYDALGREVSCLSLDSRGNPMVDRYGNARYRIKLSPKEGWVLGETAYDDQDRPTLTRDGWFRRTFEYDRYGNRTGAAQYDLDGRPTLNRNGYFSWTAKFDRHGNKVQVIHHDTAGAITTTTDNHSGTRSRYDGQGNEVEVAFLDTTGAPAPTSAGYTIERCRFDSLGNCKEKRFYDEAGHPFILQDGSALYRCRYDPAGNEVERTYCDSAGHPVVTAGNYVTRRSVYDEGGRELGCVYLDSLNNPVTSPGAMQWYEYNEFGSLLSIRYLDAEGSPCTGPRRYSYVMVSHDSLGDETRNDYFDPLGLPALSTDGDASEEMGYNALGYQTLLRRLGLYGGPPVGAVPVSRSTVDAYGNELEVRYFDVDDEPTKSDQEVFGIKREYDHCGNPIRILLCDRTGHPMRGDEGFAELRERFDSRGHLIERRFFDEDEQPTRMKWGYWMWRDTYDRWGRQIRREYFDRDGNPINHIDGNARVDKKYDLRGNQIEEAYFDLEGRLVYVEGKEIRNRNPCARWTASYGRTGELIEKRRYGADGAFLGFGI